MLAFQLPKFPGFSPSILYLKLQSALLLTNRSYLPNKANCQLLSANCFPYRMLPNALLNFCVALKSVFLAVSSVVFNISPIVRSRSP